MNRSHLEHVIFTLAVMPAGYFVGGWVAFAAVAGLFVGREHAQAEYRYMAHHSVVRAEVKWLEVKCLHPRYWSADAVLDFALPMLASFLVIWGLTV